MPQARVKLFVAAKDYGFLTPIDGSRDVYFLRKSIVDGKDVAEGQLVEYELEEGTKIPQALVVRPFRPAVKAKSG